ncbi:hypothetical protein BsWGS_12351 [Bradybaena similaris]
MASEFSGRVVIVTESNSGFGEAIALLLASKGANVTLCGRDEDRLNSVLDKIVKANSGNKDRFLAIPGDLNDSRVRQEIVTKTVEKFGRLDVLVANAAVSGDYSNILNTTEDAYDTILDTNLKSSFFLIKEAIPHLEKTRGNIVNISSTASNTVIPAATTYSLTKAALDHLTRCLAVDLGSKSIRVNSVNPGYIHTLILRDFFDPIAVDTVLPVFDKSRTPLTGVVGAAQDVAEAVAFLASDAARYITGEFIKVDGGRSYNGVINFPPKG